MSAFAVIGLAATALGWSALGWRVWAFTRDFKAGAPEPTPRRRDRPWRRTWTVLREFLEHRKLARKPVVAAAHWAAMMSFLVLVSTLVAATGKLFDPDYELPLFGHWLVYNWAVELVAWAGLVGIGVLIAVRLRASRRSLGRASRFWGSHQWRARYVEATIVAVVALVLWLRGVESALAGPEAAARFPTTAWIGRVGPVPLDDAAAAALVGALALAKLLVSYAWMVVVGLTPTMGVAWHRFLAFPSLWTSRNADGWPALGPLEPIAVDGRPVALDDPDLDESVFERLGAGTVADLTWRDRLALATCTECGRCQEVCPAWAANSLLSPKLLVGALRDHVFAAEAEPTPLVGGEAPWAVAPEALWACTTCGACVEECPVGLEQVDLVVDLRRRQALVEGDFPSELSGLFKNLERRKNPWGVLPRKRLDWAKDLDVPVLGRDVDSLDQVDYLYWVGCAGAFDDRGQATARALARLLTLAGVSFAVLGTAECCTGDPARRVGQESLFAELAGANVETLGAAGATRIVVTCAHCLNTLANEYGPFGGHYQVVHHTELLAQLVAEGRLNPEAAPDAAVQPVAYQDPCYLARHNDQVAAPRQVLNAIPSLKLIEPARSGRQGGCCGAGGGRMWQEEVGQRVNQGRFAGLAATGAAALATACPFCNVMLGDASQAESGAIPVRDVAQLLLDAMPVGAGRSGASDRSDTPGASGGPGAAAGDPDAFAVSGGLPAASAPSAPSAPPEKTPSEPVE
ncbi:MAG: (Fe-S)-binding protein [Bifidobacteriaceae bacterium]|jgi:Fe-S oxidoreductase|nr:(Fe-S)-binding protein [Bifidobacteriaceae bacterium]